MTPIFLLQEKLKQRHLRAELARSKAITQAAARCEAKTPLLDAIAEAARSAGKSGDEVLAEFVAGRVSHPTIEAALAAARKSTAPAAANPAAASTPAKAPPVKPAAASTSTAKPAATPNSPFADEATDRLVLCVRRGWLTGTDLAAARRELATRGVTIHPNGFSHSH